MPAPTDHVWTQQQFDEMSWHDNHVHAIRLEEGEHNELAIPFAKVLIHPGSLPKWRRK